MIENILTILRDCYDNDNSILIIRFKGTIIFRPADVNDNTNASGAEKYSLSPDGKLIKYFPYPGYMELFSFEIDRVKSDITIFSGVGNIFPLFYFFNREILIVSKKPGSIIKILNVLNIPLNRDLKGILSSLIFDFPINNRTYWNEIKRTFMGESLVFTNKEIIKKITWRPAFESNLNNHSFNDLCESAMDSFYKIKESLPEGNMIIPLTGGFDSRFIACMQKDKASGEIFSYTFKRGKSYEDTCAKKVASALNIHHLSIDLLPECYTDFAKKVILETGGMITPMHVHGIYSAEKLSEEYNIQYPRIFGYFGDPVTGDFTRQDNKPVISDTDRFVSAFLEKYLVHGIFNAYKSFIYDILYEEIASVYEEFSNFNTNKKYFEEYFSITQRQNNLIIYLFNYHRNNAKVYLPFVNKTFIDFFISLPQSYRINRFLFLSAAKKLWPAAFSIHSNHDNNLSFITKRRVMNMSQRFLDSIYHKQQIFKSPFIYEQHENLLRNELKNSIAHSYNIFSNEICKEIKLKPAYSIKTSLSGHTNISEPFRLITLGILYQNSMI